MENDIEKKINALKDFVELFKKYDIEISFIENNKNKIGFYIPSTIKNHEDIKLFEIDFNKIDFFGIEELLHVMLN